MVNCYCPPQENINIALSKVRNVICNNKGSDILIMGDFNAKNQIWGSQTTHEKGDKILEFLVHNNLTLLNDQDSPPTFKTARAKGWIDLRWQLQT